MTVFGRSGQTGLLIIWKSCRQLLTRSLFAVFDKTKAQVTPNGEGAPSSNIQLAEVVHKVLSALTLALSSIAVGRSLAPGRLLRLGNSQRRSYC